MTRFQSHFLFALFLGLAVSARGQTSLVNHGDTWRYHKGSSAPQSNWRTATDANLDVTWLSGAGGFGFGDAGITNQATTLSDMRNGYTTLYIRRTFTIAAAVNTNMHLRLTVDYDDGFVAYLDGVELTRANAPGSPGAAVANTAVATDLHEASCCNAPVNPPSVIDLGAVGNRLPVGSHILALQGLNEASGSSDFHLIPDLALITNNPSGVSGVISSDTTWHRANSPFTVVGSITVNSGVTLTIEPGVTVQFDSGFGLTIDGRLLAQGDPTNRIRFTRAPSATTWDGITINGGANSPETVIAYADFEFNGTTAIHSSSGTVFLDHLTFAAHDHQYVSLDSSSFIVSDCVFPSATVKFELVHGTGGIKSGGHGIIRRNFFGLPVGYDDVVDFTGGNRPGPIVQFIDNVFSGSADDGIDVDGTDAWIEGNIFLHVHRNGDTPDSSAAISGGNNSGNTSEVTIIGNLFFDCDNALTAKQGNFYTLLNNTIVHTTKTGGIDGGSGVVNVRDTTPSTTAFAKGCYLEGNIIWDAEELVRNYDPAETTVTFSNNILPSAWTGPGGANSTNNPMLKHIPLLSETVFSNWQQAQVMRDWFSLLPGSTGLGSGPNGRDKGGVIPLGASVSGEPNGTTAQTTATLRVGVDRTGSGIPSTGWPEGAGYTHYRWRLDSNAWSAPVTITTPISLAGLSDGPHHVDVVGQRDSGFYQNDPLFGEDAVITSSHTWTVSTLLRIERISLASSNSVRIEFTALANTGYTIQYRSSLSTGVWQPLVHLDPIASNHPVTYTDTLPAGTATRFYRLAIP